MIHVSNIGEIIDIQCKKDVKKVELSYFLFGGGRKTRPHPIPLPEEGGEWLVVEMEVVILGLIRDGNIVDNKE
ncbi:hypothetical protein KZO74_09555 [Prevotella salivae]|uniref:hypothetical protein n=1 Tax=Segatella salivae TaxID=228604 RepID=UPI001C5FCDC8|nr:hypothetical protein [Segatella salivae]MBW4765222.1 hypothetical protein [Segatella salivae]